MTSSGQTIRKVTGKGWGGGEVPKKFMQPWKKSSHIRKKIVLQGNVNEKILAARKFPTSTITFRMVCPLCNISYQSPINNMHKIRHWLSCPGYSTSIRLQFRDPQYCANIYNQKKKRNIS